MRRLVPALLLLIGCDGAPEVDAGPPEPDDAGAPFVEPAPPALPVFTPCPDGWTTADSGDGYEICEPPSGDPCAPGTERFVDSVECVPVGDPCPAGEWGAVPDGARGAVYVRPGATAGDGTMRAPYGSIQDAIRRAPTRGAVMLAKGTYDERFDVFGGVPVIGACAAETILSPLGQGPAVFSGELDTSLSNVTIRAPGGPVSGVEVFLGSLSLRGVVIENAADDAVFVHEGGQLDADGLVVRDVRALTEQLGRGVSVTDGSANVTRAIFERCPGGGIVSAVGSTVTASYVTVRDSGQELLGDPHLVAQGMNQRLELSSSLIEEGAGGGLLCNEDGVAVLDQVVIREMRQRGDEGVGGLLVRDRGHLEARRVRVEEVDQAGFIGSRGALIVEDSVARRVVNRRIEDVPASFGVLYTGDRLTLRRVVLSDIDRVGAQVEEGRAEVEDLTILRTGAFIDSPFTAAALGQLGGQLTLRRLLVDDCHGAGVMAHRLEGELEDLHIREVAGIQEGRIGRGVDFNNAHVSVSRVLVERSREVGLSFFGGSEATVRGVRVLDTLGRDCQDSTCPDAPGGIAIASVSAQADVRDFTLEGARLCGVMVALRGALDLRGGSIREATVGACVQVDGYDTGRLTDGVEYVDNGINVDATMHTVPPPEDPLASIDL